MPIDTETYKMIRRLYAVKGLSQRQIAKQLKVSRKTVRKYCEGQVLPDVRNSYALEKSMPRQAIEKKIIEIINANKDAPSKQKLNAKIIWERSSKQGLAWVNPRSGNTSESCAVRSRRYLCPLLSSPVRRWRWTGVTLTAT